MSTRRGWHARKRRRRRKVSRARCWRERRWEGEAAATGSCDNIISFCIIIENNDKTYVVAWLVHQARLVEEFQKEEAAFDLYDLAREGISL